MAGDDRGGTPQPPGLRQLADLAPVLMRMAGVDGRCWFFNRQWLEHTGRTAEQELGYGWLEGVHPQDRQRLDDYLGPVRRGEPVEAEFRLRRRDGAWRWILDRGVAISDQAGDLGGYMAAGFDITERRRAEDELHHSREELRLALSAGSVGSWVWDERTGRVERDAGLEAIYGLPPGGGGGDFHQWVALVYPEDRDWVIGAVERAVAEGGSYEFEHRIVRPDGSVRWVERRGQAFWDDAGEVAGTRGVVVDVTARKEAEADRDRLLAAEHRAREAAQQLAHRLANLQAVTADLADARTVDEVAKVIVERGSRGMDADSGALCLLREDGEYFDVMGHVGYSPESIEQFRQFPARAALPASDAVRDGRIVLLRSLEERDERYPNLRGLPAMSQSFATVPLIVGSLRLGAVALGWADPKEFNEEDVRFLLALGQQAAQALDRAHHYQAEHLTAQRQTLLAAASRALGSSLDYDATLLQVARLTVPDVADDCRILLIEDFRVRVVAHVARGSLYGSGAGGTVSAADTEAGPVEPETHQRLLRRLQTASPVMLPSGIAGSAGAQDGSLEDLVPPGACSAIAVPLRTHDQTLGMLVLSMAESGRRYTTPDLTLAEDLAARTAVAVANARSDRVRTEVAHTLQRSLLPLTIPLLPGLDLAARYHPIGDGSEVGGDFYDIFPAGDGRWGVVIGDVSGKGVLAASLTALARYTIRTAARREPSPSSVLAILNDGILDNEMGERFATIAHALVEHTLTGVTVLLSRAGHPPPLLLDCDGTVRPIGRSGTAVGLFAHPTLYDDTHALQPGQALIFHTDGLIEARSAEGVFADGLLERILAGCTRLPATAIADRIQDAVLDFQGGRARDDMALLVLRHPPEIFHRHLPIRPDAVSSTRRMLAEWLAGRDPRLAAVAEELLLTATELTTNAVRLARHGVQLHVWLGDGEVTIDVCDDGPGFDQQLNPFDAFPDPWSGSGRGLYIVRALMDSCEIQSGPSATVIRCRKRL